MVDVPERALKFTHQVDMGFSVPTGHLDVRLRQHVRTSGCRKIEGD